MNDEILGKIFGKAGMDLQLLYFDCDKSDEELLIFNVIFSHEFAKAFFGEAEYVTETDGVWYDGVKLATSIEELKGTHGLSDLQSETLKTNGVVQISDYIEFKCTNEKFIGDWKYHLQKMVLEKEPLKYLEKFLNKD